MHRGDGASEEMTESQRLHAVRTGAETGVRAELHMDSETFAGFYERTARPLWAYLARASRDAGLADDLTQESFVRFLCATVRVDGEVEARRYLFRIATNLMKDHWRRRQVISIEETPEGVFASDASSGQVDAKAWLEPAMARMSVRERQMLWLAYAEGYSHKEIAEVMALGATSVRLLLFRARKKVAALLTKGGAR
jgi:RNA polymerase sigma-70 factor (ECF subfamily)